MKRALREGTMESEEFHSPLFDQSDSSNLHSYVLRRKSEGTMEFYSSLFDQSDGSNLHSYVLNKR